MASTLQRSPRFFVLLSIVSMLAVGLIWGTFYWNSIRRETREASRELSTLMELRTSALEKYLKTIRSEVVLWSNHERIQTALLEFVAAWKDLREDQQDSLKKLYIDDNPHPLGKKHLLDFAEDGSDYSKVHAERHPWLRRFLQHHGYYDLFLFDRDGNLVYTAFKENDFATNFLHGSWKDSGLGRAFRAARSAESPDFIVFEDFAAYGPSHGAPASFIASPIFTDGEPAGVFALQLPIDKVERIMQFTAGMGETGETYLVGSDLLMRSNSRFSDESTILRTTVDTKTVHLALQGKTGAQVTPDYRGLPVLSAYGPLEFEGTTWAVMAEIDRAEIRDRGFNLRRVVVDGVLALASVGIVVALFLTSLLGRAEKPSPWTEPE